MITRRTFLKRSAEAAGDEVDLERPAAELLRVVEETMQPKRAVLWPRDR